MADTLLPEQNAEATMAPTVPVDDSAPPKLADTSTVPPSNGVDPFEGATLANGAPPSSNGTDPFEGATPVGGGSGAAVVQGAVKGAVESTGLVGGAIAGFSAGMKLPIPHPIAKAAVVGASTIAGAAYGIWAGHNAVEGLSNVKLPSGEPLTVSSIDDVPPHQRSAYIFGENVGAGVPFIGSQVVAAKMGVRAASKSFVGSIFNDIMNRAATKTGRFVAAETITSAGAGIGGAIAQEVAPDELAPRVFGEITGGILPSFMGVTSAVGFISRRAENIVRNFSPAARETSAARIIQDVYATAGDDIELAAKMLRVYAEEMPDSAATVAQRIGDMATISLEQALVADSAKFSSEAARRAEATLSAYKDTIKILRGSGDAEALKEAATIEARYFTLLLSERAMEAKRIAAEAAEELLNSAAKTDRTAISLKAYEAADTALQQSRAVERQLWDKVPTDIPANTNSIVVAWKGLMARRLPREEVPRVITETLKDLADAGGKTDVGFLKLFRSRMLSLARQASGNPERASEAAMYGHLAEAALDDIDMVFKNPETQGLLRTLGMDPDAFDRARNFSRALHESFTNTFTGENLRRGPQGLRLAPEALLGRAMAGGPIVTEHRLKELEESTRFLIKQGYGGEEVIENVDVMLNAQRDFVSIIAADVAGIETGPAKTAAIRKYMAKNPELMDRFPDVKRMLDNVATSQEALEAIEALNKGASNMMSKRTAWAKLAGNKDNIFDSPVDAISASLRGRTPVRDFTNMAKLAVRGASGRAGGKKVEGAIEGFNATVFDHAIREATIDGGAIDFKKLRSVFFDPIRPGKPSIIDIMKEHGTMSDQAIKSLVSILDKADTVVKSQSQVGIHVDPNGPVDYLMQMVSRLIGSHISTGAVRATGGGKGGTSLIVASAGARMGDRIMNAIPSGKVKELLIEAVQNPELMIKLMEKPVGEAKILSHGLTLHSMLVRLGVIPITPMALGGETLASDAVSGSGTEEPK